jgi:hypothetical protein
MGFDRLFHADNKGQGGGGAAVAIAQEADIDPVGRGHRDQFDIAAMLGQHGSDRSQRGLDALLQAGMNETVMVQNRIEDRVLRSGAQRFQRALLRVIPMVEDRLDAFDVADERINAGAVICAWAFMIIFLAVRLGVGGADAVTGISDS